MNRLQDAISAGGEAITTDLYEREDSYLVVADFPGVSMDGISIRANEEIITINATRDESTFPMDPINRSERDEECTLELPVPIDVDHEAADASLSNGVLELRLPRVETTVDIPITEE